MLFKANKKLPDPNGVNSVPLKVMMMMMMTMISSMTNHPYTISTLLMKVMTLFLIVPTMIITSMTTCHQISFAKMKKWIPHLKGKVDPMKKPILHLNGKMDLTLAPVDQMMPIRALSFFLMMKQHSALPHSF
jgi:hypothetical protein